MELGKSRWPDSLARRALMLGRHLQPSMTVLELGCGIGYFIRELARSGANIILIDVSPELPEMARANCSEPNDPLDFLHPKKPVRLIDRLNVLGRFIENLPLISEPAGSLYIRASK
jgi:SAM-dependent methyltransferase